MASIESPRTRKQKTDLSSGGDSRGYARLMLITDRIKDHQSSKVHLFVRCYETLELLADFGQSRQSTVPNDCGVNLNSLLRKDVISFSVGVKMGKGETK